MIALEEVTTFAALEALAPEWSALYAACIEATPFQSPEWLLPWWKYFGAGQLWSLALRREGKLVGLAPFFIGALGERSRHLWMIGTGVSDYLDLLLHPEAASTGLGRIKEYLVLNRSRWDLCDFQELRAGSPLLSSFCDRDLFAKSLPQGVCPVLSLPERVEALRGRFAQGLQGSLRHAHKRLERSGGFSIKRATKEHLPEFLEAFFRLHQARWKKKEEEGVLADTTIRDFHQAVASGFAMRGSLRLYGLRHRGEIIAALYAFSKGERLYCYLSGFDPRFQRFSPGAVILEAALREAIEEGIREADFLRGRESYKYLWGATDRINYRLWIWHASQMQGEWIASESVAG